MAEVEQTGPLSKPCPGCGVQVPPGYPKCPRCHTVLPQTQPGAGLRRPATDVGGGTSVGPGMDRTLILIGAGAIVLIALVTWALASGGDDGARPPVPAEGSDLAAIDDSTATAPDVEPPSVPPDRPPPVQPPAQPAGPDPRAAIAGLGAALRGERLWASVSADGAVVVIRSSFCEDGGLTSIVDGHAAELRDAKFTAVRCRAPHGEIMFERDL